MICCMRLMSSDEAGLGCAAGVAWAGGALADFGGATWVKAGGVGVGASGAGSASGAGVGAAASCTWGASAAWRTSVNLSDETMLIGTDEPTGAGNLGG